MRVGAVPDTTFTAQAAGDPMADGIHAMTLAGYTIFEAPCAGLILHEAAFSDESGWRVSDARSGYAITKLHADKAGALHELEGIIYKYGDRFAVELQYRSQKAIEDRARKVSGFEAGHLDGGDIYAPDEA